MSFNKISIIIPALNEEKLIRQVLSQFTEEIKKKNNLEVIVSDGGSKDRTVEVSKEFADCIVEHKENFKQNISRGRNQGAKASDGDVLIFLNADTLLEDVNKFFEILIEKLNFDGVVALTCPVRVFKNEEKTSDKIFHFLYNKYVRFLNRFVMGMGRGECHIVKREAFEKCGGYNENLFAGEDFDLYRRIRKSGKILFINDFIVYESPRRYRKFGYVKVFWDWAINSISITLFKKSISKVWEEVR